jgi:hypothetical protein
MDIDSLPPTMMDKGIVSRPAHRLCITAIPISDTPMPNYSEPIMDFDEGVLNISPNLLDNKQQNFY